jgi:hypothetical protein
LTRAKAAALSVDEASTLAQKPLQSKKSTLNANSLPLQRKRAALGDVSNVAKSEIADGKKGLSMAKTGLVSKASQPTGIQKNLTRSNSTRSILGAKDTNKTTAKIELKRTGSGSGVLGAVHKKRQTTSSTRTPLSVDETATEDEEPARKRVHTAEADKQNMLKEAEEQQKIALQDAQEKAAQQELAEAIHNLDAEDVDDPLMVAEYVHEIFDYLRELEVATLPNADYMEDQKDLEWKMRGILVDWLIEVHNRFHLLPETLFLAVNIIDRFLSRKVVRLDRLQLIGVTGMFIASKYEEVLSPHVASFRHVADDGFSEAEILSAERWVLGTLDYDLSYPNPMNFLRRISKADAYDIHTRTLGKYLMEISLLDHRFMNHLPSHIAAAAMYLARMVLERGEWVRSLSLSCVYTTNNTRMRPLVITRDTMNNRLSRYSSSWLTILPGPLFMKLSSKNMQARNSSKVYPLLKIILVLAFTNGEKRLLSLDHGQRNTLKSLVLMLLFH